MPEYRAPGVYIEEVAGGAHSIDGVATSTAGVVGATERGPIGVAVALTSAGEFARRFGGPLDPAVHAAHRHLPAAVAGFFANGGRRIFVVRAAAPAARCASARLPGRVEVRARDPGAWGNRMRARLLAGAAGLRLEIATPLGLERHAGLSLDPAHARYLPRAVDSPYAEVYDLAPGNRRRAVPARPRWVTLAGGDDAARELDDATIAGAVASLAGVADLGLIAAPGETGELVQAALIAQCEARRDRFALLDAVAPPADNLTALRAQRARFDSGFAAIFVPWLAITDPFAPGGRTACPPSGHLLGVYARVDAERGVHAAPADEELRGALELARPLGHAEQVVLNAAPTHINVVRDFRATGRGLRVWGTRAITGDPEWKYVNVRRLAIYVERSIDRGLRWVVFEPNDEPLWAAVRRSVADFLTRLWRDGMLLGDEPEQAFFVRCDRTTMSQDDIEAGRLVCLVGIAPVKPAEFVPIRIAVQAGDREPPEG